MRPLDLRAEGDRVDARPLGGDDRRLQPAVGERDLRRRRRTAARGPPSRSRAPATSRSGPPARVDARRARSPRRRAARRRRSARAPRASARRSRCGSATRGGPRRPRSRRGRATCSSPRRRGSRRSSRAGRTGARRRGRAAARCRPRPRRPPAGSAGADLDAQAGIGRAVGVARRGAVRPRCRRAAPSPATTTRGRVARDRVARGAAVERRDPHARHVAQRRAPSTLIAFARPSAMSPPEWPPRPPPTVTRSGVPSAGARGARKRDERVRAAGAADGQRRVLLAVEVEQHAAADERRVERERARHARPPRRRSSAARAGRARRPRSSASAIIAAIATPLSAPSVVPSARSQPSSRTTSMRPARGSFGLSGSRSQTMSRWPWRITVGRGLAPGRGRDGDDEVAGGVAARREAVPVRPGDDVRDGSLLLVGRPGDPRERGEVAPERLGLQPAEGIGHGRHDAG